MILLLVHDFTALNSPVMFVTLDINRTERSARTQILACAATDTAFVVDNRNF